MNISYNWIQSYIAEPLPEPEKLADILTFSLCEIESLEKLPDGDSILDLNILPNRAHDLLSHQGIAREIAGILNLTFKDPTPNYVIPESHPTDLKITIETPMCHRYMGRIVRNIKVGPSPEWLVKHLESIGQRSINNIVDATNLNMYDCGQPCHAFDLNYVPQIIVKNAIDGEEFPVLGQDKVVAKLKSSDMMITDGTNSLAIAGVKGGLTSGVTDTTTDIVLEVANFDSVSVRKTARRLNLLSDSAKRFENDLSPSHGDFAMLKLSSLISKLCPEATFEDIIDIYPNPVTPRTLQFSTTKINSMLGTTISHNDMISLLTKYGFEITTDGDISTLNVPMLRLDLTGTHDLAEEVLRLYGIDKVEATPLKFNKKPAINSEYYQMLKAQEFLINNGYKEVMTYSFRKKGIYEVAHGVGDKGALRTDLSAGVKESFEMNRLNMPFLEIDTLKIFEIGKVFTDKGEELHIALADKKGIQGMTLDQFCTENNITVSNDYDLPAKNVLNDDPFIQWSVYPFIVRDIAVWVADETSADTVYNLIKKNCGELLVKGPRLFDTFSKDGKTSYAFRMVFQSRDRTLTEEEISEIMRNVTSTMINNSWEVR